MCMYVYIMYVYTPTPCLSHFSAFLSLQPCTPVLGAYNFSFLMSLNLFLSLSASSLAHLSLKAPFTL